jgi:dihydroorotate dehydrogenase (NAD+) catalytic subunit
MPADISVSIGNVRLKNPTILASGIADVTKKSLERAVRDGAGAVTTKSITLEPRKGHGTPVLAETPCGFLNAIGIANPGIDTGIREFSGWDLDAPLIFNVACKNADELSQMVGKIADSKLRPDALELAVSCPHTPGYGTMAGQSTPENTRELVKAVKAKLNIPIIVKLSPNAAALGDVAKAAEAAGAAAINMGNTAGPGMSINIERKKKELNFGFGGLSGPALKPIAVRCVYDVYEAVKIPVIGTGGVTYGKDAIEMFMAGASAVGIGTALYYRGPKALGQIAQEITEWMEAHQYSSVKELVGIAHD